jgi:hypothetical protein
MSATGTDPQPARTGLRRESRIWSLIRRTLPVGRSIGSLLYLISVGLIATWIIAVFFGVSFFFLLPQSANLASGLSRGISNFNASLAETPWLMQSTSRLDRLSASPRPSQPLGDAASDQNRPAAASGSQNTAAVNPRPVMAEPSIAHAGEGPQGQALSVEPGSTAMTMGEAVPVLAPQSQLATAPEPRGSARSSRKTTERRTTSTRASQAHAPVNAIQDVLQKHSGVLK